MLSSIAKAAGVPVHSLGPQLKLIHLPNGLVLASAIVAPMAKAYWSFTALKRKNLKEF